ncbi:sigma 54-interacting transcriptional regulator [Sporomusa sphaeroides]|uniref:HTH-type transcriptional regulatory protein TyrR n=1 Tax=Sporomusa sphaeroides DSM 2875 TaxID=1337886 RepID=A0ABM9W6S2_9FIRM|nr:sigma 54-interacting transcriptional regulator [Sporomusa sphaeroides]OLS54606.1 transcriptional regulatory protein TyrR [Sporomusa sphaeroides DSM 2875]CVK20863.1 Transcriptional regulatory protein TyrR [Sporomusa sphaeroides DSM 2875]
MRLCMPCTDRVGLLLDVSRVLAESGINIASVEMERGAVYLKCQTVYDEQKQELMHALQQVDGIYKVIEVSYMPSKERAEQLDAILASVQDGVLAVNELGILKQCNTAAASILGLDDNGLEQPLPSELADSLLITRTLQEGRSFRNREVFLDSIGGYCVVSTRPLRNDTGGVVGVVVMLRDSRDVREMIQKLTASLPVTFRDISCVSPAMEKVLEQARRYAGSSSTVLIRGETGTGKELFARALHSDSPRAKQTFIPVNCAAIPEALLESELFGYEEGAFTGAAKGGKPGLFELANGGTLFLDEIGEISVHLQAKLLRALQEKRVRRLGGSRELPVDVRIITATNRDLEDMVARQLFREDLYYRLNVIPLFLPPLRERAEDIPLLAEQFLKRFAAKLQSPVYRFSAEAREKLQAYSWPGNVRELENIIERAVNLVDGPEIKTEHLHIGKKSADNKPVKVQFETYQTLEERVAEVEREILRETMKRFRSSRRAGAALGLSHTAVIKKMKKHGLWPDSPGKGSEFPGEKL